MPISAIIPPTEGADIHSQRISVQSGKSYLNARTADNFYASCSSNLGGVNTKSYEQQQVSQAKNNVTTGDHKKSHENGQGDIVHTSLVRNGWQLSFLCKKYVLLKPAIASNTRAEDRAKNPPNETYTVCIHRETGQQFSCKVVAHSAGFNFLAVLHRLGNECDEISRVVEVFTSPRDKCFNLIMPITFGTVHSYLLHCKTFKQDQAANIFKQMVKAVQHCHREGVVLKDLKLSKFVFRDKERTLVELEGLEDAVLLHDPSNDAMDDKKGCPQYTSPEKTESLRCDGKTYPGKTSDIWSLGIMLYCMLVGRYPFTDVDNNCSKIFYKIRNSRVMIPPEVPVHARFLIRCILHKDLSKRPTCGELLNHVWLRQCHEYKSTDMDSVQADQQVPEAPHNPT